MKLISLVAVIAGLGVASPASAGWGFVCCNRGIHCVTPPSPSCPDCSDPCCHGPHWCTPKRSERAHRLIDQLCNGDCCARITAARKLGCRLHADYCCDPEVLTALARAVQCDTCWEVRKAAAWAIAHQNARTRLGVLSLYLASRLDPHYLVRDAARDALDVLLVCRRDCFKDLFVGADELVKVLRGRYNPTAGSCVHIEELLASCGSSPDAPVTLQAVTQSPGKSPAYLP